MFSYFNDSIEALKSVLFTKEDDNFKLSPIGALAVLTLAYSILMYEKLIEAKKGDN